jgi:hypothetical protein
MLQDSCNTEITNFDTTILVHENILSFQITMQNLSIMDMLNSKGHLHKPVKNLILTVTNFSYFLLICYLSI